MPSSFISARLTLWTGHLEAERAVLRFAEALTITGQAVTDELFAPVRAHYSEAEVVELTAAIAVETFRSKFNIALGVEAQGFCVLP